jgi:hypothetical protein
MTAHLALILHVCSEPMNMVFVLKTVTAHYESYLDFV